MVHQSNIRMPDVKAAKGHYSPAAVMFSAVVGFALLCVTSTAQAGGMMRPTGMRMMHVAPAPVHHGHRIGHIRHGGFHPGYHRPMMHGSRVHVVRHPVHAGHPAHTVRGFHSGHPIRHMGHVHHQRPVIHQPFPKHGAAHMPAYFHPGSQQGGGHFGACCNQGVIVVQPIVFPQGMGGGHHAPFIPKVNIPAPKVHRPFS